MEKTKLKNALFFLYIGFFFISASLVMLQVLYTRTLSVAMGFGLEFIVISLAILGFGLGGILVFFLLNNLKSLGRVNSYLITSSLIYVIFIPIPFLLVKNANSSSIFLFLIAGFFSYFLGGVIASLLFRYYVKKISKLYFLSLLGSAFGALGIIVLLELFGTSKSIVFLIILSSFSILFYVLQARPSKKLILSAITLMFVISVFALSNAEHFQIVCPNMSTNPIATKSDALSRIDIYPVDESRYEIVRNCHAIAPVINYNTVDENELDKDARIYFPFPTNNFSSALMIGTAGGRGVIQAVRAGIGNITAVEINPLVIEGTEILEESDNIYHHDSVEVFVQEGRAFISASEDKYDLIYLLGLRFARIGYGSHILSENYLYTKEAFDSYFEHLNENGTLAIGVNESLLSLITETLAISLSEKGIDPTKRIVLFEYTSSGEKNRGMALVKNSDFSEAERDNIIKGAAELDLGARFLTKAEAERYQDGRAMTDDYPYFYGRDSVYGPRDQKDENMAIRWLNSSVLSVKRFSSGFKYISLLFAIIVSSWLLIALIPLYKSKTLRSGNIFYLLGFFSAIGMGFITLELSFIHKFTLFLGHPILSLSVTLGSVLFFGGLGSLLTGRFKERDIASKLAKAILTLVLIVALFILSINFILSKLIFLDTVYKIIFAISVLSMPSFLMGMVFPLGLKIAGRTSKKIIPWMLGIDGVTSVLGGMISFMISLTLGFNTALVFGIAVYIFALLMVLRMKYEI